MLSNNQPLTIGFGAANYFTGSLCEVRVYRRALTEPDLARLGGRN